MSFRGPFEKLDDAAANRLTPLDVVFSHEMDESSKRKFWIGTHRALLDHLRRLRPELRTFHEHMDADERPTKLFFDVDAKYPLEGETTDAGRTRANRTVAITIAALRSYVFGTFPSPTQGMLVLDSSRDGKNSKHVIFDVAVRGHHRVLAVAEAVIRACAPAGECIDVGVYKKRRTSLRLPYCTKYGKASWLAPHHLDPAVVDEGVFLAGCLLHDPRPPVDLPEALEAAVRLRQMEGIRPVVAGEAGAVDASGWTGEEIDTFLNDVLDTLKLIVPKLKVERNPDTIMTIFDGLGRRTVSFLVKGLRCRRAGRVHRNNHTMLFVGPIPPRPSFEEGFVYVDRVPFPIFCQCMHPECGKFRWPCDELVLFSVYF